MFFLETKNILEHGEISWQRQVGGLKPPPACTAPIGDGRSPSLAMFDAKATVREGLCEKCNHPHAAVKSQKKLQEIW